MSLARAINVRHFSAWQEIAPQLMGRSARQLYGLFARPGPRFDPIKIYVLANAFEVLDVVAEGAPHALKVHALSCTEAGEEVARIPLTGVPHGVATVWDSFL